MNRPTQKLGKILILTVFIIFAFLFLKSEQYLISLLTLGLIVIILRITDLNMFSVNSKGINAKFSKASEKLSKVIKSNESQKTKLEESQKLIDEIFKLGYQAGGKPYANIWDVKIRRDQNGKITGYEYSEN